MVLRVRLVGVTKSRLGASLFDRVASVCSSKIQGDALSGSFERDSQPLQSIHRMLQASGWRLGERGDSAEQYVYEQVIERVYSDAELEQVEWFCIWPRVPDDVCASARSSGGHQRLDVDDLTQDRDFGVAKFCVVVPDRVKSVLLASDLIGIEFVDTECWKGLHGPSTQQIGWSQREKWWEMTSRSFLPPLSSENHIVTRPNWAMVGGDPIVELVEGDYYPPQLSIRRSVLAFLPSVDMLRTSELFGAYRDEKCRYAIVSQRFRQVCLKSRFNVSLIPVALLD